MPVIDENLSADVGAMIRKERKKRGWSQTELAEAVGSTQAYVSNTERGRENPPIGTVSEFAKALGRKIKILFT